MARLRMFDTPRHGGLDQQSLRDLRPANVEAFMWAIWVAHSSPLVYYLG